jgi:fatty-acyl-CoA synthase
MITRGGENIYPVEIEDVLATCPGLRDVAVVGVPDEHWGEVARAHVVLEDGGRFDERRCGNTAWLAWPATRCRRFS